MQAGLWLRRVLFPAILISLTCTGVAQGPPGQAKKYFRDEDRDRFYAHYRGDADHWRGRRRPVFVTGEYVAREYVVQPVPRGYWVGVVAAPPPGYQYGYCDGYVVAWNPATRMVADVLDLVATARGR